MRIMRCGASRVGPPRKRGDGQGGFTMMEILISMLLMAIMLTGLAALQIGTIRNVTDSKRYSQATRLAESVIERYQTAGLSSLPATSSDWVLEAKKDHVTPMQSVSVNGEDPGPFTVQRLVEDMSAGRRLITVRVSWLLSAAATGASGGVAYRTNSVLMAIQRSQ